MCGNHIVDAICPKLAEFTTRRVVENAFGVLTSKFRVFEKKMSLKLETVDRGVLV